MTAPVHHRAAWYPWLGLGLYQVTWFAALLGGAAHLVWPGLVAGGVALALHVACTTPRVAVITRLVLATVLGVAVDSVLALSGTVAFAGCTGVLPPLWMVVLWPCFAALFDGVLRWLPQRPLLALVLGLAGGPLAYVGGVGLGALTFPHGMVFGVLAVALAWGLAAWLLALIWHGTLPSTRPPVGAV